VTIGDNVVAAAHTLIHKDVPPNSLIFGVPYKIIKNLNP
jgi:acetyltransferase-like isoleucine patch superfamily enzyme